MNMVNVYCYIVVFSGPADTEFDNTMYFFATPCYTLHCSLPTWLRDTRHDPSIGFKPAIDIVSDTYLPMRPDLITSLGSNIG